MVRKGILFIAVIFSLMGCGEDQVPLFEMKIETSLDISPGSNTVETFYYPILNVPTSFQAYAANLSEDDIGKIQAANCLIEGGFTNINYDFIEEIYINAIDPEVPNVRQEIFYLEFNPIDNNNELQLFGSLVNVKDIFINDLVHLEVRIRYRAPSPGIADNRITLSLFAFAEE